MALIGNSVFPSSNPVLPHPCIKTRSSCSAISALKNGSRIEEGSSLWRGHYARRDISQHGILMRLMTNPDDFEVGRFIGDYGYMNITSYNSLQSGSFLDGGGLEDMSIGNSQNDIDRLRVQDVQEGPVKIRLYDGRVALGIKKGTPVLFKVYPGKWDAGYEADMMAANELNAHAFLQDAAGNTYQNLQILLGAFETSTGEQWLAFRNDGRYSAADYARIMSESVSEYHSQKEWKFWNPFVWEQTIKLRQLFVIKILRGVMSGLAFMHDHDMLHQSLGPASIVLNTIVEKDVSYLVPHIRDLAFSFDIRYASLESSPNFLSESLWQRARAAGAFNTLEKRTFGIADDIFEDGLLFAYLAFVPFCEAGMMDGPSLQKLFESTFQLNVEAVREYCQADDHLSEAVKFLDLGDCAGWELLQAMLNPDFRRRPTAATVLNHRFMTGNIL